MSERADDLVFADDGTTIDDREGTDDGIASDADSIVDAGLSRILDCDTILHELSQDSLLNTQANICELASGVDSKSFFESEAAGGFDDVAGIHEYSRAVGKIVFALTVIGANAAERLQQPGRAERVAAGVDFRDESFVRRGVLLFDNSLEVSVFIADDSSESFVVLGPGGADDAGGLQFSSSMQQRLQ
jgi:hypothetical protein